MGNVDIVVFSTEDYCCDGYIFLINKDFEIKSTNKRIFGYYFDLTDKEILNLKQFKIEII